MAVADQFASDCPSYLAGSCDGDAHQISLGPDSNADSTASRSSEE
ncbi:unannotated protein [freshwater metagenome]|uniref:Unannotated protein n=1 Tax=freshwater metagenome TaxID=449393 RepID=A0A6J7IIK2_9ZZZZ